MRVACLEDECDGGKNVGKMHSEEQFAEAAIGEAERGDGIDEKDGKGKSKEEERGGRELIGGKQRIEDEREGSEGAKRKIEQVVAQGLALAAGLTFGKWFDVEAEDFGQERHGQLGKQDAQQPQPEGTGAEGLAEVVGDAGAEGVGQRGEEQVEGAEEFQHL